MLMVKSKTKKTSNKIEKYEVKYKNAPLIPQGRRTAWVYSSQTLLMHTQHIFIKTKPSLYAIITLTYFQQ